MDDETLEIKAAHRLNAPVTKPELFTYEYSSRVVKPLLCYKTTAIINTCKYFYYFLSKKTFAVLLFFLTNQYHPQRRKG